MGLPNAVQRASDEADKLLAQMQGDTSPETTPEPEPEPQEAEPVQEVPETQDDQPKPEEPVQGKDTEIQEWKQKFATLQGKYNAEVPRLHQQLQQTNQALQGLKTELEGLRKSAQPSQPATPPVDADLSLISESYGEDTANAMQRLLNKQMSPLLDEIKQLKQQLNDSGQQVNQIRERQTLTDEQQFWKDLGKAVPDYEVMNNDQGFLVWLGELDPLTGVPRQTLLDHAHRSWNGPRAAAFFKTYKDLRQPAPPPKADDKADELARQVAPGKTRGGTTETKAKTHWTDAKIRAFYADYPRLAKTNPAEAERLDKEITAALERGEVTM